MSERPDFSELTKSPYEDEARGSEFSSAVLVPVIALVVGVLTGIILARVGAESPPVASPATTTTTSATAVAEPLEGFPDGYVAVAEDVAVKVLTAYEVEGESYVVVAGVTRGGADRDTTFMQSFGEWALVNSGGEVPAWSQTVNSAAPGMFQIRFPTEIEPGASLTGVPGEAATPTVIRLEDDAPTQFVIDEPQVLDVDGTAVTIDYLEYDLDEGYGLWHTGPESPAVVEVVVTLVGTEGFGAVGDTDLPIRIGTFDSWATFLDQDVRADVPPWNTRGELRLGRQGRFRFNEDLIETVTVDAVITLTTNPGDPITIPIE